MSNFGVTTVNTVPPVQVLTGKLAWEGSLSASGWASAATWECVVAHCEHSASWRLTGFINSMERFSGF